MEQRLNIDAITPEISNWTCKVQVVDIGRPGEGRERKIKYMNMIFQDEQKNQIKAILYGDDIPLYQQRFMLFHTYLITSARVQQPTLRYERPLHTYDWIIDKKTIVDPIVKENSDKTIVDPINEDDSDEDELPPPTIVTMTSFQDISEQASRSTKEQLKNAEFNVLAIVVNCFPSRYVTSMQKTLQELIVIDTNKQALTFTLWEEAIIKDEGTKLLTQFQKRPIIFARRVGVSKYNGTSLTTKFNTTIQIDPPYSECVQLQAWIAKNEEMLNSFAERSTSKSGFLISVPVEEEIVSIANIQSQQDGQSFTIEAKITLPNNLKYCYVLTCPNCGQEVRNPKKRKFHCANCNEKNMLASRCRFEVTLEDASGSITGIITDEEGEKLLSLNAEEIYAIASTENESQPMQNDQLKIHDNFFRIQVKKSLQRTLRTTPAKVLILSASKKENMLPSLPAPSNINIEGHNKEHHKYVISPSEQTAEPKERHDTLKQKPKLEPPTPMKMK